MLNKPLAQEVYPVCQLCKVIDSYYFLSVSQKPGILFLGRGTDNAIIETMEKSLGRDLDSTS